MYTVDKVIFYLNDNPVHTRTTAPFDADYTYTGLSEGTHSLKAEIYSGATLVDAKTVSTTIEASEPLGGGSGNEPQSSINDWAVISIGDYVNRINAEYGNIEDDTALGVDLSAGTEQDYLDAIAIYNPNGGYRTGKIYDVTDTTNIGNENIFSVSENFSQVKGALRSSLVEERSIADETGRLKAAKILHDTNEYSYLTITMENQWLLDGVYKYNYAAVVKKGDVGHVALYFAYYTNTNVFQWFNLNDGTIGTNAGATSSNPQIQDLGNDWYLISVDVDLDPADRHGNIGIYAANSETITDIVNGNYFYISRFQITSGYGLKPYYKKPSSDLTVTGGGSTRINANGDVEDIVINKIDNSLYLTPNSGVSTYTVESNIPAPDGSLTAKRWTLDSNTYGVMRRLSAATGQLANYSIYARAGKIRLNHDNHLMVEFDANAGTYEVTYTRVPNVYYDNDPELAKMTDVGDGWYRCSIMLDGNLDPDLWTDMDTNEGAIGSSVELWGEQLSFGSLYVKPFQLTTGTAAYPKIDYSTGRPAFLIEPTITNNETHSYDLITNTAWTINAGGQVLLNETGIEGKPNTALTLTDSSTTDYFGITRTGITLNKKTIVSIWIKKDSNETRFPEIYILFTDDTDGSNQDQTIHLNTKTGAWTFRTSQYNDCIVTVRDRGLWWEVLVTLPTPSNPVRSVGTLAIRPAMATTIGNITTTAQGSIILGHVGIYTDTTDIATPIITNGTAVTRTTSYYEKLNLNLAEGTLFIDMIPSATGRITIALDSSNRSLIGYDVATDAVSTYIRNAANGILLSVGTTVPNLATSRVKAAMTLKSGAYAFYVNGVKVGSSTNTGIFTATNHLKFAQTDGNSNYLYGTVYDLRVTKALTDQEAIDLTTIWLAYYYTVRNYVNRVNNAYGVIENEEGLTTLFENENLLETEYDEINGWYTPIGGHRTGKIYDLSGNKADLTVTGGGGTRINANGDVESVMSKNLLLHSFDYSQTAWTKADTTIDATGLPDAFGGNSAYRITVDTNGFGLYQSITTSVKASEVFTVSVWLRTTSGTASVNIGTNGLTNGQNNRGKTVNVTTTWQKFSYALNAGTNGDTGLYANVAAAAWAGTTTVPGFTVEVCGTVFYKEATTPDYDFTDSSRIKPKIDYSTGQAAFLIEPSNTNVEAYSYDLITNGAWSGNSDIQQTLDQVGIEGKPNTGLLLTDSTTLDYGQISRNLATFSDEHVKISAWIKKDEDETRFPEFYIQFRLTGGVGNEESLLQINTKTGVTAIRAAESGYDDLPYYVYDRGDWWEIVWTTASKTDRLTAFVIRPAFAKTLGGYDNDAMGSITIGHIGIYTGYTLLKATPIITTGTAITRTEGKIATQTLTNPVGFNRSIYACVDLSDIVVLGATGSIAMLELNSSTDNLLLLGTDTLCGWNTQGKAGYIDHSVLQNKIMKCLIVITDTGFKIFGNGALLETSTTPLTVPFDTIRSNDTESAGGYRGGRWRLLEYRDIDRAITDQEAIDLTTI